MAVPAGSFRSGCCRCFLLVLLLNAAAVRVVVARETPPLGANCDSIDPCRAGVANDACCKAINVAIVRGTCSCACRQLGIYGHAKLASACSQKGGCPMCRDCRCSGYWDGAPGVSSL